jgi:DNA replicative helicase MCM subunit Mcm2 (Cdc46/Mcm family)
MADKYILKIEVNAFECQRCGHIWIPRVNMQELKNKVKEEPMICPSCKTPYWRTKRKNKKNKEVKK